MTEHGRKKPDKTQAKARISFGETSVIASEKILFLIDFGSLHLTNQHFSPASSRDGEISLEFCPVQSIYEAMIPPLGHTNMVVSW